jgi:hypothetical protein
MVSSPPWVVRKKYTMDGKRRKSFSPFGTPSQGSGTQDEKPDGPGIGEEFLIVLEGGK